MKNKKNKIIFLLISALVLAAAFFFASPTEKKSAENQKSIKIEATASPKADKDTSEEDALSSSKISEEDKGEKNNEEEKTDTENKEAPVPEKAENSEKNTNDNQQTPSHSKAENNESKEEKKELYCTLSITCKSILDNIENFDEDKKEILPQNGIILPETKVVISEGESVFDLLERETKKHKIHLEFSKVPAYNSAYIEGIANIYEFDCGELSGWMYRVNGEYPSFGCSLYTLKGGETVDWIYTCDLGRDIGGGV